MLFVFVVGVSRDCVVAFGVGRTGNAVMIAAIESDRSDYYEVKRDESLESLDGEE